MTATLTTINALMQWLNHTFGLRLPLLPLTGWPSWCEALWNLTINWTPPSPSTPPFVIPVHAGWQIPTGSGGHFTVTIVSISVQSKRSAGA